jgi:hypothetical protein
MAQSILIVGDSGSGKSTGIKDLNPEETYVFNTANKPLPFKGWKSKYSSANKNLASLSDMLDKNGERVDFAKVRKFLDAINNKESIKTLIIDDFQYIFAYEYFARANEKGYDKFTQLAKAMADIATYPIKMRDDLMVIFLTHSEEFYDSDGNKRIKAKTIGKMIDNVLTLEGLFSIVLFSKVSKTKDGIEYIFETKNSGDNTCKSPMDMFESETIPNDLAAVREAVIQYEL